MLPKATQIAPKVQGSITFDLGTQLKKRSYNTAKGIHIHTLSQTFKNIC